MKSMAWQATPTPVLDLLPSLLTTKTNRPQRGIEGPAQAAVRVGDAGAPAGAVARGKLALLGRHAAGLMGGNLMVWPG